MINQPVIVEHEDLSAVVGMAIAFVSQVMIEKEAPREVMLVAMAIITKVASLMGPGTGRDAEFTEHVREVIGL